MKKYFKNVNYTRKGKLEAGKGTVIDGYLGEQMGGAEGVGRRLREEGTRKAIFVI